MNKILAILKKEEWSPYWSGAALGVVAVLSVALSAHPLGASGSFENIGGLILQAIAPTLVANNLYFRFIMPPGITWQVILMVGVFCGAFAASRLSRTFRLAAVPDPQWRAVFGPNRWKRWIVAFLGGVVLEYGAGIAGGCTSGLAIAGGVALAPAAFLFIGGMFVSGILTAMLLYGSRY